ncbi:hypothetical protein [Siccirubricoccus phaeus]|uniref:hypothetical protein n=1 Tax=Siccirubricoccus phaeus TaxID=2595053 RepID=UPI00165C1FD6|nr:hypothetical protein [Siccirubricoccus phaeus]
MRDGSRAAERADPDAPFGNAFDQRAREAGIRPRIIAELHPTGDLPGGDRR